MSPIYRERVPSQFQERESKAGLAVASPPFSKVPNGLPPMVFFMAGGGSNGPSLLDLPSMQSWLVYHRPLQNGETLSYEFFYQPGEKMVYPSLGRTALLLEPDGVPLHWITDIPHVPIGGLRPDNAVAVTLWQRGPKPLPLKPGAWNSASVSMTADRMTLRVNGVEVYEIPRAAVNNRVFGLFHYRNRTEAQVRHIKLTGGWPTALSTEQLGQLTVRIKAPETPQKPAKPRSVD